jgi:hypothetical protein
MNIRSAFQSALSQTSPVDPDALSAAQVTHLTFKYDCLRAIPAGMLESAGSTFLLLIAVQAYQAGATEKALIAAGGNIGMLLTPIVVQGVEHYGWPTSRAAALIALLGGGFFLVSAVVPTLALFVLCSVVAMACTQALVPLLTQIYQENYAPHERGRYYSRSLVIRVAASALFAEGAGRFLTDDIWWFPWLLVVFGVAFVLSAFWLTRIPSRRLRPSGNTHPLRAVRYVLRDHVFAWTLVVWMVLGFANLMMLPLRVEYLANPRFGLALDASEVALLTAVIPSVARLLMGPVWGWIFDRANFFVLRMVLNVGFALGILTFFAGGSMLELVISSVIFGVANSGGDLAWSLWVTKFAPADRVADYMSVHAFLTGVRGVAAPMLSFQLLNTLALGEMGLISAGLIGIATLMLIPEIRYDRQHPA